MPAGDSLRFGSAWGEAPLPRGLWLAFLSGLAVFLATLFVSIAANSLALGLAAIAWAASMLVRRRWDVRATPLDAVFLAYGVAELLASALSVNQAASFYNARRLLLLGIVYVLATHVTGPGDVKRVLVVLLGTATLVSVIGVVKTVIDTSAPGPTRLGIFQFYMTTSGQMMVVALLLLPFVLHRGTPGRVRWLVAAALVPVLVSLYATVTRGAYMAFLGGAVLLVLLRNWRLLFPLLACVAGAVVFAPPYVAGRIASIIDPAHADNASRLVMWDAGLKIWADHPWVGVGDIDLGEFIRQYAGPGYTGTWGHLHNNLLHILATLGLVGLGAALAMFVMIIIVEWRVYRSVKDDWLLGCTAAGALAVFTGIQIHGLTEWSFGDQEIALLLWTTVGLAVAAGRISAAAAGDGGRNSKS